MKENLGFPLSSGDKTLEIEVEENKMRVSIEGQDFECNDLRIQNSGAVAIAAYHSNITFHAIEVVCRDTINPIQSPAF